MRKEDLRDGMAVLCSVGNIDRTGIVIRHKPRGSNVCVLIGDETVKLRNINGRAQGSLGQTNGKYPPPIIVQRIITDESPALCGSLFD